MGMNHNALRCTDTEHGNTKLHVYIFILTEIQQVYFSVSSFAQLNGAWEQGTTLLLPYNQKLGCYANFEMPPLKTRH